MRVSTFICLMACAIGLVRSDGPSDFTTCEACIDSGYMWVENADCTQECKTKISSSEAQPDKAFFRRRVVKDEQYSNPTSFTSCSVMENKCQIVDAFTNPSFEEGSRGWTEEYVDKKPIYEFNPELKENPNAPDGSHYVWFCGIQENDCAAGVKQTVTIPTDAMYLSFYIFLHMDTNTLSGFTIYIDDKLFFRIDKNIAYSYPKYFFMMDLDITKYADEEKHEFLFRFVERTSGLNSQAFIDYVTFIKRDTPITYNYNSASLDQCFSRCPKAFLEEDDCYDDCNNLVCGYDNGHCDNHDIKQCIRNDNITKKRNFYVCPAFKKTCCSGEEVEYVTKLYDKLLGHSGCTMDFECRKALNGVICAPCSGWNREYIRRGNIQFCDEYADEVYAACATSYLPIDGRCIKFIEVFKNVNAMLDVVSGTKGLTEDDRCYSGKASKNTPEIFNIMSLMFLVTLVRLFF